MSLCTVALIQGVTSIMDIKVVSKTQSSLCFGPRSISKAPKVPRRCKFMLPSLGFALLHWVTCFWHQTRPSPRPGHDYLLWWWWLSCRLPLPHRHWREISRLMSPSRGGRLKLIFTQPLALEPELFTRVGLRGTAWGGFPSATILSHLWLLKSFRFWKQQVSHTVDEKVSTLAHAEFVCVRESLYAQWTWAPALECRFASLMQKASCSSLISFSLFSSRNNTKESLMSTTSISSWRIRSSSACCSEVLSARKTHTGRIMTLQSFSVHFSSFCLFWLSGLRLFCFGSLSLLSLCRFQAKRPKSS